MATAQVLPGEVVDVAVAAEDLASAQTKALARTEHLEFFRLVVPAGKLLPTHKRSGELAVYCVQGKIQFFIEGQPRALSAGQFLCLPPGVPHAVRGVEDAVVLLTVVTACDARKAAIDMVQEASEESFPASDPPARTPITGA